MLVYMIQPKGSHVVLVSTSENTCEYFCGTKNCALNFHANSAPKTSKLETSKPQFPKPLDPKSLLSGQLQAIPALDPDHEVSFIKEYAAPAV